MPLGEMLDLEKLAHKCREQSRWFFFFSSSPANVPGMLSKLKVSDVLTYVLAGGVASHVNGNAIL
jgi:hypothetical protein